MKTCRESQQTPYLWKICIVYGIEGHSILFVGVLVYRYVCLSWSWPPFGALASTDEYRLRSP